MSGSASSSEMLTVGGGNGAEGCGGTPGLAGCTPRAARWDMNSPIATAARITIPVITMNGTSRALADQTGGADRDVVT